MDIIKKILGDGKYEVELKEKFKYNNQKNYLKTVSSFANGNCTGYIIFGIKPISKEIIGINNVKKTYEAIFDKINTEIQPRLVPVVEIINIEGKNVISLKIVPGQNKPYYYINSENAVAYIRKDGIDVEANELELSKLILKRKNN